MFPTVDALTQEGSRIYIQPTDPANASRFNGHNGAAFDWTEKNSQNHGYSVGYYHLGAGRDVDHAAALMATNPDFARTLITHRFPLDAAPEAFATAGDRASGAIKVVLEP